MEVILCILKICFVHNLMMICTCFWIFVYSDIVPPHPVQSKLVVSLNNALHKISKWKTSTPITALNPAPSREQDFWLLVGYPYVIRYVLLVAHWSSRISFKVFYAAVPCSSPSPPAFHVCSVWSYFCLYLIGHAMVVFVQPLCHHNYGLICWTYFQQPMLSYQRGFDWGKHQCPRDISMVIRQTKMVHLLRFHLLTKLTQEPNLTWHWWSTHFGSFILEI